MELVGRKFVHSSFYLACFIRQRSTEGGRHDLRMSIDLYTKVSYGIYWNFPSTPPPTRVFC